MSAPREPQASSHQQDAGPSPRPRGTFASLAIANYRRYFAAMLVSNTGLWMSRVAQDWLVLTVLTDHSSTALGAITAAQFAPIPLLSPFGGSLADRFNKRKILLGTQTVSLLTATLLAMLVLLGHAQLWQVFVLAGVQGATNALDMPTRQAFASELVPAPYLANAVALNSTTFQGARLVGPAVAGLMIAAWGTGVTMLVNALSFVAVIVSLLRMNPAELHLPKRRAGRGGVREGLAYVRGRPDLQLFMFLAFMLGTFGMNFQITNALMATEEFRVGPEGYGLLGSVMAIGSLLGALTAARRARPSLTLVMGALAAFALTNALDALAPTYAVFAALLMPIGLFAMTAMTTTNTAVQLGTDEAMRGRVMALYMAVFQGGTPIGAPVIGWVADHAGVRPTLLATSSLVAASLLVAVVYQYRTGAWGRRRGAAL